MNQVWVNGEWQMGSFQRFPAGKQAKAGGDGLEAGWTGHTKNGELMIHVTVGPFAGSHAGAPGLVVGGMSVTLHQVPALANGLAERVVGRKAMIEALRRQRLKVSFDEWTDADEAELVQELRREAEDRERTWQERQERIEREQKEERELQALMARSNSSRKRYMTLEALRAAEARKASPQNERNRVIREAVDAANGQPVQVACEFELPDGSKRTAIMAVTTVHGIASRAEAEIRSQLPGMRQHAAKLINMTLVKESE